MRFEGLLARSVRGFWATSYSFSLKLFDQYVLRRLSQGQLNAVVLADHDKIADLWENLPESDRYLARQTGRRYLLRGLKAPGGGTFHPKTYLFARADSATLVVGSGNLTRDGIDHGREVFTSFSSEREADLPSMRAWSAWMSRLVAGHEDGLLRERWAALRESSPWMHGPFDSPAFLVNDERPLLEQLAARLPAKVTELHLTAPFFDRDALALEALLRAADPERLVLYLGRGASVHGPSLAKTLGAARDLRLRRFEPSTFVHAKLVGALGSDGSGVLLSGSPNLSRAALTMACAEGEAGNCETAVLRESDGERVRAVFEGSGLELVDLQLKDVEGLVYEDMHPGTPRPLLLRSAAWRGDGRIAVDLSGAPPAADGAALAWVDGGRQAPLGADGATVERLDREDPQPLIVWLVDGDGIAISNRVAVDDPAALDEALLGLGRKRDSHPPELSGVEMAPLVRLVLWAHDKFIFDLDDVGSLRRAQEAAAEEAGAEDASDFWERYAREELGHDPRSQTYRPLTPSSGAGEGPVEELLRELQLLLHAAPDAPPPLLRVLAPEAEPGAEEDEERGPGAPWSMAARQRVRAYNLLNRWCGALADPRQMLVAPEAPVVNYETLLGLILAAWLHDALDVKHLRRLLLVLLRSFVGAGEGQGFLGRAGAAERDAALARLDPFVAEAGAGLVAVALHSGWRSDIYEWQAVVRRALALEAIMPGQWSTAVYHRLVGKAISTADLARLLEQRVEWVDDETWCERLAEELELEGIRLDLHRNAKVRAAAHVRGADDPLHDVRLLTVARRALEFKRLPAIAIFCGADQIMIFEPSEPARARVDGVSTRAATPTTVARLEEIERQGGSWADLLEVDADAA